MATVNQRILPDVGIILAPSFRSRAYAQRLAQCAIAPAIALLLPGSEPDWEGVEEIDPALSEKANNFCFRPGITASETLMSQGIPTITLPDGDINGDDCCSVLAAQKMKSFIYSGAGGTILSSRTLSLGPSFLHVHGGYAPAYRGSTAFYYSIIKEGCFGATALWLNEGLDTGPVLSRRTFPLPSGIDIDRIYDPAIRADLLADVMEIKVSSGDFPEAIQPDEPGETYFVIHPVLKHLALKSCGLVQSDQV